MVSVLSRVRPCSPVDCSPPGSSVHGILQAGIPEWAAIPFSRGSCRPGDRTCVSCIPALQADSYPWCHLGARPPWHVTLIPSSEQTGNKGLMIPTLEKRKLRGRWSSQGHRAGTCYDWNCHGSFCLIPESGIFPQCEAASRQEEEENQGATPRATVTDT